VEASAARLDAGTAVAQEHTFDELMLLYMSNVSANKRASERDRFSAKRLYPVFTGRVLERLGAAEARTYIASRRAAGAQPGTIN
jgi:hypothetical protein